MAAVGRVGPFAVRDADSLVAETKEAHHTLNRAIGAFDLTAIGVGSIIGTGIFVIIGEGVRDAGPAVIIAFLLAALASGFTALSYAELASSIPVSGSAYTYSYATLGDRGVDHRLGPHPRVRRLGRRGRDRLGREPQRVVGCAFIDTPDGHEALAGAAALARRIPARLRVYTVIAPRSEVLPQWIDASFVERAREQARQALDAALADLTGGVDASAELLVGDVVDALAALDERDVSLLVCGSRGYGPVRRVLLGGVSARLVRHAAAPVMVVPRSAGDALRAAVAVTAGTETA